MSRYVANMGMPAGTVRRPHSMTQLGGIRVPVFTADPRGDAFEGHIRVPNALVRTRPFTNERHRFHDLIAANVKRWVEWREHKGWRLNSKPKVQGPFDWPTANALAETPDYSLYTVTALFQPTDTLSMSIDDAWELKRRAEMFGVDTSKPKPTSTPIETGKDVIFDSGPFRNAMEIAEENRQAVGLKREDLLIGPLSEPWPRRK